MLVRCDCEHSFRFSLSYYLHFVDSFQLVPAKEIRPLCALVNELTPSLKRGSLRGVSLSGSGDERHRSFQTRAGLSSQTAHRRCPHGRFTRVPRVARGGASHFLDLLLARNGESARSRGGDGGGAEHECELGECVMYSDFLHAILLARHAYS